VAKELGIAVAQVAPDGAQAASGPLRKTLRGSLADATLLASDRGRRPDGHATRLLLSDGPGRTREAALEDLVPALEALLADGPRA